LKLNKFHQQLHNCKQILKDGSLLNIDGGRPESNAIHSLKKPGSLTQKRMQSLTSQVARNIFADQVMTDAMIILKETGLIATNKLGDNTSTFGSRYIMKLESPSDIFDNNVDDISINLEWQGQSYKSAKFMELCKGLAKRIFINVGPGGCLKSHSSVEGFTEYHNNGVVFRSHPSYKGSREWMDWALIKWDEQSVPIPAKIFMFLNLEKSELMTEEEHELFRSSLNFKGLDVQNEDMNQMVSNAHHYLTASKWVVIQSCLSHEEEGTHPNNNYRVEPKLGTRYYLESKWRLVPIETIVDIAYCLEIGNESKEVVCLDEKSEWYNHFLENV
jgi:hypothetical protein